MPELKPIKYDLNLMDELIAQLKNLPDEYPIKLRPIKKGNGRVVDDIESITSKYIEMNNEIKKLIKLSAEALENMENTIEETDSEFAVRLESIE